MTNYYFVPTLSLSTTVASAHALRIFACGSMYVFGALKPDFRSLATVKLFLASFNIPGTGVKHKMQLFFSFLYATCFSVYKYS